ncbi:hypothetical protein amrb99_24070 [Actinomadura sp. RB99]|nr:hypothetical protein [Actinomadura sp. RB99]
MSRTLTGTDNRSRSRGSSSRAETVQPVEQRQLVPIRQPPAPTRDDSDARSTAPSPRPRSPRLQIRRGQYRCLSQQIEPRLHVLRQHRLQPLHLDAQLRTPPTIHQVQHQHVPLQRAQTTAAGSSLAPGRSERSLPDQADPRSPRPASLHPAEQPAISRTARAAAQCCPRAIRADPQSSWSATPIPGSRRQHPRRTHHAGHRRPGISTTSTAFPPYATRPHPANRSDPIPPTACRAHYAPRHGCPAGDSERLGAQRTDQPWWCGPCRVAARWPGTLGLHRRLVADPVRPANM